MSGIFGVFNRNGKPIEEKIVHTMLDTMSYWEPDERDIWIDGSVALGHTMLWNTPESKYEHLPLQDDIYVLTMDARIDNRDELAKEIKLPDRPLFEIGDSEFILGAYKKWGEECPEYLLGDFVFAIWDEGKKQIFCAKDHIGVKQFFYHISDDIFLFGNDLKSLTMYSDFSKKINDEAVANYFVHDQLNSRTLTFFEDFMKLPPAHSMIITTLGMKMNCYWKLEEYPRISLPSIQNYAEKLRELFEQSIYDRMRSDFPITSHLSGGLDSSAIAAIAAQKLKNNNKKLLAYNWLHTPSIDDDLLHFEWYNSAEISRLAGNIKHYYVDLTANDIYDYMQSRDIAYGETIGFWYEYKVRKSVRSKNSRTILSGWGGDDFLTYQGRAYYSDLVCKCKIKHVLKELKQLAKEKNVKSLKSIVGLLYSKLFIPFVPRKIYCYLPKNRCENIKSTFPVLNKNFLKLVNRMYGKRANILPLQPAKTIKEDMLLFWENGGIHTRLESWAAESIGNRLTYAYPMLDKRIIEFMMNVPSEYLVKEREGRYLFRLAVKDLLPEKILWMKKEQEVHRVNAYLNLLVKVYKTILEKRDIENAQSTYIESENFLEVFEKVNARNLTTDFLLIDAGVSILLSKILRKKDNT